MTILAKRIFVHSVAGLGSLDHENQNTTFLRPLFPSQEKLKQYKNMYYFFFHGVCKLRCFRIDSFTDSQLMLVVCVERYFLSIYQYFAGGKKIINHATFFFF